MANKNNAKFEPRFCQMLIDHMNEGGSIVAFVKYLWDNAKVRVCRKTIYNWRDQHPEFAEALEWGADLSQGYWEGIGHKGMWFEKDQPNINTAMWRYWMETRFPDWRTKAINPDDASLDPHTDKILVEELKKVKEL